MERYLRVIPIPVYVHDRQVAPGFVPEHEERYVKEPPVTFSDFLADISACIAASGGKFKTLRDQTPFLATFLSDQNLQIKRVDSKVERVIALEELESAWAMLQTGLLTVDQYGDEGARRYKSYISSILAELPYIRHAEIQRPRNGHRVSGHGLFIRQYSPLSSDFGSGEGVQGELCLSR